MFNIQCEFGQHLVNSCWPKWWKTSSTWFMRKCKNLIFFSIFKNIVLFIIYWMNKICWPMVNNYCWLNKYIFQNLRYTCQMMWFFIEWSSEVFKFDKFFKILYIFICNSFFNIVDHLLTKYWTLLIKCIFK